jgi:Ca2+-binding RTX toxin-like protein
MFVLRQGDRSDTITDFAPGKDKIDLTDIAGLNTYADLHMTQSGANVLIDLSAEDHLIIQNMTVSKLSVHSSDFLL